MKRKTEADALALASTLDQLCPDLPLDDKETFQLFAEGNTDGIYMMESDWDKYDLQQIKPSNMEELTAAVALSHCPRVNPYIYTYIKRAAIQIVVHPVHEALPQAVEILRDTRGMIIYKEQVEVIETLLSNLSDADRERYRVAIHILRQEIGEKQGTFISREFCAKRALLCYKLAYLKTHDQELFDRILLFAPFSQDII